MKKRRQEERGEPNKKMRRCVAADVCVGGMEKEKAETSRGRRRECKQLSIEAVEMYVKYRSFDVIGCGSYRKYVNARKEAGEAWAGKMLRCVGEVTAAVRTVHGLVEDLQAAYNQSGLYQVCQAVIENNTPPVDQTTVIGQCVVSKKEKCNCILLRCKGRGAVSLSVQSRFSHFILMLWTVYKVGLPCLMCACKCLRSLIPFVCLPSCFFFFGVCKTTNADGPGDQNCYTGLRGQFRKRLRCLHERPLHTVCSGEREVAQSDFARDSPRDEFAI
jgi:hypothetical protein